MFAASPLPPSAPSAAPPSRRVLDAYEKLIIGCGVVGLIVVAAAIIGLPAPDAGAADTAPTVVVVSPPTVAPEVGATFRADSIAPLPSVAAQPKAVIRPAVAKAMVKKPPQIVKPLVPARAPGSLCERHVSAEAWNDTFEACTAEAANGKALAQRRLALLYVEGHGTGRSEQQATKW